MDRTFTSPRRYIYFVFFILVFAFGQTEGQCDNLDFSAGNFGGWTGTWSDGYCDSTFLGTCVCSVPEPFQHPGIVTGPNNASLWNTSHAFIMTTGFDSIAGPGLPVLRPGGGEYSARLGNIQAINDVNPNAESLTNSFVVTADNHRFTYHYAAVLNDGAHPPGQQAFFQVQMVANGTTAISAGSVAFDATTIQTIGGAISIGYGRNIYYMPWQTVTVDLSSYIGDTITITFITSSCKPQGCSGSHFSYAYIVCDAPVPSISSSYVAICNGNLVTLTATGCSAHYHWTGPGIISGQNSASAVIGSPGLYIVQRTPADTTLPIVYDSIFMPSSIPPTVTNQSICAGDTFVFYGRSLTAGGSYADTLTSLVTGCDSLLTLNLSLIQSVSNISNSICSGDTFHFYGRNLTIAGTYTDTLTSVVSGCDSIINLTLTVNQKVPATITISASVPNPCNGETVTFTAVSNTANAEYFWWKNGTIVNPFSPDSVYTSVVYSPDIWSCVLEGYNGCFTNYPATSNTVYVRYLPTLTLTASAPGCQNADTLKATGYFKNSESILWYQGSTLLATNPATDSFYVPGSAGTYNFHVIDTNGCTAASGSASIYADTAMISITGSDFLTCGGTAYFVAQPQYSTASAVYQWTKNSANVGTNSPVFSSTTLANHDTISCIITTLPVCGNQVSATSNSVIVLTSTNYVTPVINVIQSPTGALCNHTPVNFTLGVSNGGNLPLFQWFINDTMVLSGASSLTLYDYTNGERIYCRLISSGSCARPDTVVSSTKTITVPSGPPSITIQAPINYVCSGINITSVVNGAYGTLTYQWMVNGVNVPGATSSTWSMTAPITEIVTCAVSGSSCFAQDTVGSNALTINGLDASAPTVTISGNPNPAGVLCSGVPIVFTAVSSNGGSFPVFKWFVNDTLVYQGGASFTLWPYSDGQRVYCRLISSNLCASPDSVVSKADTISGPTGPAAITIQAPSIYMCPSTTMTLTASVINIGNSVTYQWQVNGSNVAGATYSTWTMNAYSAGIVTCKVTGTGCFGPDTAVSSPVTITTFYGAPTGSVSGNPPSPICPNSTVIFTITPGNAPANASFQWYLNNVALPGDTFAVTPPIAINNLDGIRCTVKNTFCTSNQIGSSPSVYYAVQPFVAPSVSIAQSPSGNFCRGTQVTFTAQPVNVGTSTVYNWTVNGVAVGNGTAIYTSTISSDSDIVAVSLITGGGTICLSSNTASSDADTLHVKPVLSTLLSQVICYGASYVFQGRTLTAAGLYSDTLTSAQGCDSIVTLVLGITLADTTDVMSTICPGSHFNFNGQNLSAGGIYRDTLTSTVNGCDSIINLYLTVNPVYNTTLNQSVCAGQSYNFNGSLIGIAGTYYDTLSSTLTGCDSVLTLNLAIGNTVTSAINHAICQGDNFNFNGRVLTLAGDYNDTLASAVAGCDSIVTLHLTYLQAVVSALNHTICAGDNYLFNNQSLTAPGTYTDTLTSFVTGCDSIAVLTLTVVQPVVVSITDSICVGDSFNFNGVTLTTGGNYVDTLASSLTGCDSIAQLDLVVKPLPVITYPADTTICTGNSIMLIASSTGAIVSWQGGYTNGQVVAVTQNIQFVVSASASGCIATDTFAVATAVAAGVLYDSNTMDCLGDTIMLSASGGVAYQWWGSVSGNITTTAVTQLAVITSQEIFVQIFSNPGCSVTDSFAVVMLPERVWPGDANEDLVVNNYDVLAIGLAYGTTGPLRLDASNAWQMQCAPAWADSFSNGTNYAFADCNGDGVIDYTDTDAVSLNYSLTHTRSVEERTGPLALAVHTNAGSYHAGDVVTGQIILGTSTVPASAVYGIAFTVNAGSFAVPNTLQLSEANTWILTAGNALTFEKRMSAISIDAAQTRINHTNVTGNGVIANFSFVVDSSFAIGSQNTITANAALCVNNHGDTIGLTGIDDTITAIVNDINGMQGNGIVVYPNPTTGYLVIQLTGSFAVAPVAEVYDMLGQVILSDVLTKNANVLDLSSFANGIYLVKVLGAGGLMTTRKVRLVK